MPALIRAADAVNCRCAGRLQWQLCRGAPHTNVRLYGDDNPLEAPGFESKVKLLAEIDAYVRDKDPRVRQVFGSASAPPGRWWKSCVPDGESYRDIRTAGAGQHISVVAGSGDRQESGSRGYGGPRGLCAFHRNQGLARLPPDAAIREAMVNLESVSGPGRRDGCGARAGLARGDAARGRRPTGSRATSTASRPRPLPA